MINYLRWVLTRWYFWGIVIIHFIYFVPKNILPMMDYLGIGLKSWITIFLIFSSVRFFFFILGKIIKGKPKKPIIR